MNERRAPLQELGSAWLTVVLLCSLMACLAGATLGVVEEGAERTHELFYQALWFKVLVGCLAVNLSLGLFVSGWTGATRWAGVLIRAGVLTVLAGGLVTQQFGVTGQLTLVEGHSLKHFNVSSDAVWVQDRLDGHRAVVELEPGPIGGPAPVDVPETATLELPHLGAARILSYLPDMQWTQRVTGDGLEPNPAVLLRLSSDAQTHEAWIFPQAIAALGAREARFHVIPDRVSLKRMLPVLLAEPGDFIGLVRAEFGNQTFEFPIEECFDNAVPIGESGFSFQVLQYMPHAVLGSDDTVVNQSERPVNPAIELVVVGPTGAEKHVLFAKDPEIEPSHVSESDDTVLVAFLAPERPKPDTPIEVLMGPDSRLYARLYWVGSDVIGHFLEVGQPVETPWPGTWLTVVKLLERARVEMVAVATESPRIHRSPGLLLELLNSNLTREFWLQKGRPRRVTLGDREFELTYGDAERELGFEVRLNRFRVDRYPGGSKPRSFESQVTLTDHAAGISEESTIDMSHPASFAGLILSQSSYRVGGDQATSVLSVSRDPGRSVLHAGLLMILIGLSLLLSPWQIGSE